jgi:hypothetical protein
VWSQYFTRRRLAVLAALVLPLLAVVLYSCPPTEASYYPRCTFHALTGLHCPGCGATRCLYALLHGELAQAVSCNLLVLLALPFLAVWGLRHFLAALRNTRPTPWRCPPWALWSLTAGLLAFGVLRNIPAHPFTLLAPRLLEAGRRVHHRDTEDTEKTAEDTQRTSQTRARAESGS